MKKILLVLMLTVFVGSTLFAQERQRRTPEEMAKSQTENLTEKLGLSVAQKDSVYKIYLKSAEQMQAMRTNAAGGDRDKMREQFTKSREQVNKDVKAILTADQQKKYDELAKEMQNRGPGGNREGRPNRN